MGYTTNFEGHLTFDKPLPKIVFTDVSEGKNPIEY